MKDATITQDEQTLSPGRFPSVVTTDDLVYELGKQVVDKLNKEKLLEGLLKKKYEAESQIIGAEKTKSDSKKQVSALEESNRKYEENNRALDQELVRMRQELSGKTSETQQLIVQYNNALIKLKTKLEIALKPKKRKYRKKKITNG